MDKNTIVNKRKVIKDMIHVINMNILITTIQKHIKQKEVIFMVKIEVFTSPMCPHCPAAKRVVEEVVSEMGGEIEVENVNVMEAPERAAKYGIMAVPTIVIDGEVKFVGAPTKEALKDELSKYL